ncbi:MULTISPECIES: GrpB family protein [Microbacterium]|nr:MULTISPECIES: GrpB family protein [Microbacterium]
MAITVAPYSPGWPVQFERVAAMLRVPLRDVRIVGVEHSAIHS